MGKYDAKSREELLVELEEMQKAYDSLLQSIGLSSIELTVNMLKEYQAKIKYLMTAAHLAWWEFSLKDNVVIFDERKAEMLGYPPEKFKYYQDFTALLHPDDCSSVIQTMKDHLEGRLSHYDTEYRIKSASGDYIWFRDIGSIVNRGPDGKPEKLAGIVIDITQRKIAEEENRLKTEQLQLSNNEKDTFFSIIAHDLKGPLNSFMGYTDLMMTNIETLSMDSIQEIARVMNDSAAGLYNLLENLLEWSKIKRGLTELHPDLIYLSKELEFIKLNQESAASKKQIDIQINVDDRLTVFSDSHMLKSILRNLLSNAIKFTPKGGHVYVTSFADEFGYVVTEVKDDGIGMNQILLNNLFRLDSDTKRPGTENEPTSGLGLILCKDFVEANGGSIWVKSEEGRGSSFFFSLPVTNNL